MTSLTITETTDREFQVSELKFILDIVDTIVDELCPYGQIKARFDNNETKWKIIFLVSGNPIQFEVHPQTYDPFELKSLIAEVKLSHE
jgi:hypothetical protein